MLEEEGELVGLFFPNEHMTQIRSCYLIQVEVYCFASVFQYVFLGFFDEISDNFWVSGLRSKSFLLIEPDDADYF